MISIDAKKKELLGNSKNGGSDYGPQGEPIEVNAHDFEDKELGKVVPYGVSDIGANLGYVSLGNRHQRGCAVNAVRCWLDQMGWKLYPGMSCHSFARTLMDETGYGAGGRWKRSVSGEAPDDHGRRRRLQWFTAAALEVGPPTTRGRNRSDHSGLPLSARDFEVEQDRASHVLPHHAELARDADLSLISSSTDRQRHDEQPDSGPSSSELA